MKKNISKIIAIGIATLSIIGFMPNKTFAETNSTGVTKNVKSQKKYTKEELQSMSLDELATLNNVSSHVLDAYKESNTDEELKNLFIDKILVSQEFAGDIIDETPIELPKDGDSNKLNVGWTRIGVSFVYCKDQNRIKVDGWQLIDGKWYYFENNKLYYDGWLKNNGTWYYLNDKTNSPSDGLGVMKTGWLNDNGTWYYLKSSGAMATGWLNDNGTWYYLNSSGAMLSNTTINGYKLGASGAWIQ